MPAWQVRGPEFQFLVPKKCLVKQVYHPALQRGKLRLGMKVQEVESLLAECHNYSSLCSPLLNTAVTFVHSSLFHICLGTCPGPCSSPIRDKNIAQDPAPGQLSAEPVSLKGPGQGKKEKERTEEKVPGPQLSSRTLT